MKYDIDNTSSKLEQIVRDKRSIYYKIAHLPRLNAAKNDKFITTETPEEESVPSSPLEYSYGYRFFYWHDYKWNQRRKDANGFGSNIQAILGFDHGDASSVTNRYKNLKEEMIQNEMVCISIKQIKHI